MAAVVIWFGFDRYLSHCVNKKPRNSIFEICEDSSKDVVVCLGDSLTHGVVSYNYVNELSDKMGNYKFINGGTNSDTSYNLLQKISLVYKLSPKFIIILIGSNDLRCIMDNDISKRYIIEKGLDNPPSFEQFRHNLYKIIKKLKSNTKSKIALCSIPLMGEDVKSKQNLNVRELNSIILDISKREKVYYLPFFEGQLNILNKMLKNELPNIKAKYSRLRNIAIFKKIILRKSWFKISQDAGLKIHSDTLHLNREGVRPLIDLIISFISKN